MAPTSSTARKTKAISLSGSMVTGGVCSSTVIWVSCPPGRRSCRWLQTRFDRGAAHQVGAWWWDPCIARPLGLLASASDGDGPRSCQGSQALQLGGARGCWSVVTQERHGLDALLAGARLGQSGVLIITGEAGIGKTALLDQVRASAEDIQVLSVTGTETERDLPFAGLAQLLRVTKADLAHLPPPQAEALGVALALSPGDTADRFAVGAGLLTLLTQRSEVAPLCLIIDDAHQLDPPSQDALLFVARRLLADAIAVIVAFREGEPCRLAGAGLPQLTLTGIGPEATGALVRAELGRTRQPSGGPGARPVGRQPPGHSRADRRSRGLTASPAGFPDR